MNKTNIMIAVISLVSFGGVGLICYDAGWGVGYKAGYKLGQADAIFFPSQHHKYTAPKISDADVPVIYEDELPGIGAEKDKPDTCLAYYDRGDEAVRLKYLH